LEIDHEFKRADACELPFQDKSFDAVYSAHMLYHIEDPAAQEAALAELIRVVRAGGVVVLVSVNPRPFLFPARLLRRIAAETPVIRNLLDKLRPKPPLPYRPMPISWIRRQLALSGAVSVLGAGIPSHSFNQNVSEVSGFGAFLWKSIRWIDTRYPNRSAHLGNYFVIACRKHSHE
jgi:SAM-dependent methyltransferase